MEFNLAAVQEAIATAMPDHEIVVFRDRRLRWADLNDRTRRLANYLLARGLEPRRERSELRDHESGQHHLALYLYNGNEYVEGMLGAFKARVAPFNVNYRYVEEELIYLLKDSKASGILYQEEFAPRLGGILGELPGLEVLIQVADGSGHDLLPGAVDYEGALAAASPQRPAVEWSPDDLYILYTGGTTGQPKGVLWRQGDIFPVAMGGRYTNGSEKESLEAIVAVARPGEGPRIMICPPLMHGAAQWSVFGTMASGGSIIFPTETKRFDPADVLSTAERERVTLLLIVGDAFARPLLDQLARRPYDLSALSLIGSGGAALSQVHKSELAERLPGVTILDAIGASETGGQGTHYTRQGSEASTGSFAPARNAGVLSGDLKRVLRPEDPEIGWLAQSGRMPLGYLGDPDKTARTFPFVGGERWSVPGDRARYRSDGVISVLGRDASTINSGGEKIYSEEVEQAIKLHPAVHDAVVCGRKSERWGEEVVALVRLREGMAASAAELLAECGKHLARYKLPKALYFEPEIRRSPTGKPDYRWARARMARISN
jgi:fatty-acyl-CoA synthase